MPDFQTGLEAFGRALQGFGFGIQGKAAPFEEQDIQKQRLAQQKAEFEQTLGLHQAQFEQTKQMNAAQIEQIYSGIGLQNAQLLKLLQPYMGSLTKEDRAKFGTIMGPSLIRGLRSSGALQGPEISPEISQKLVASLLEGGVSLDDLEALFPRSTPQQRNAALKTSGGDIKVAMAELQRVGGENVKTLATQLASLIPMTRQAFDTAHPELVGKPVPWAQFQAWGKPHLQALVESQYPGRGKDPILDEALTELGTMSGLLEQSNITSPKTSEAQALKAAQEATPGGQATIAREKAQTLQALTPTVTPLQMGAGYTVTEKGPTQRPQLVQAPELKPTPLSSKERELLTDEQAQLTTLNTLHALYSPNFVGPARGRLGGLGEKVGTISAHEAEFRAQAAALKNAVIKLITGAQMSEQEATRIIQQIPVVENPPAVFEARLRQTYKNILTLTQTRREFLIKTGGINATNLPPLPKPQNDPLDLR